VGGGGRPPLVVVESEADVGLHLNACSQYINKTELGGVNFLSAGYSWPLRSLHSSIKPEAHNVSQRRYKRTRCAAHGSHAIAQSTRRVGNDVEKWSIWSARQRC